MATISCKQFLNQLGAWMEGQREKDAQAHLRSCASCREVADEVSTIAETARAIGIEEVEPPPQLWNSLRAQLVQEGLIRETPAPQTSTRKPEAAVRGWRGWFAGLPRPALAGAYLAALVALGVVLSGPISRRVNDYRWRQGTQESTHALSAQLDSVERTTLASLASSNPVVTAALHKNMAIVDNYITLCEKSVQEEPESEVARDYLYEAYQQKADLLARLNEQGE
jgi:hypothetical protein